MDQNTQELDQFKQISIIEYLKPKGWQVDKKDSDKKQGGFIALRKEPDHKIIVKFNNGWFYVNKRGSDKGSIIDYLKNFENLSLGQVRQELRPYLNNHSFPPMPMPSYQTINKPFDREAIQNQWNGFIQLRSHAYLINRGINIEVQLLNKFNDTFRLDNKNNLIFPYYDKKGVCGYEFKNKDYKRFSKGGLKGLWLSRDIFKASMILICESVIDCFSYEVLNPNNQTGYIATGGTLSETSRELLKLLIERNQKYIIAVDNDQAGDEMAGKIQELSSKQLERIKPKFKDWNAHL